MNTVTLALIYVSGCVVQALLIRSRNRSRFMSASFGVLFDDSSETAVLAAFLVLVSWIGVAATLFVMLTTWLSISTNHFMVVLRNVVKKLLNL